MSLYATNRVGRYGNWKSRRLDNYPASIATMTEEDILDLHMSRMVHGMASSVSRSNLKNSVHAAFIHEKVERQSQARHTREVLHDWVSFFIWAANRGAITHGSQQAAYKSCFEDEAVLVFSLRPETPPEISPVDYANGNIDVFLPPQFRGNQAVADLIDTFKLDLTQLLHAQIAKFPERAKFTQPVIVCRSHFLTFYISSKIC